MALGRRQRQTSKDSGSRGLKGECVKTKKIPKKLMPLAIISDKRFKHIEIVSCLTDTRLKLHRDYVPLLIGALQNLDQMKSRRLLSFSDLPS